MPKKGEVYLTDKDQNNGKHGRVPLNEGALASLERRRKDREQHCP